MLLIVLYVLIGGQCQGSRSLSTSNGQKLLFAASNRNFKHFRWFNYFKPASHVLSSALCHVGQQHWDVLLLTYGFALFTEGQHLAHVISATFSCGPGLACWWRDLLCGGSFFVPGL